MAQPQILESYSLTRIRTLSTFKRPCSGWESLKEFGVKLLSALKAKVWMPPGEPQTLNPVPGAQSPKPLDTSCSNG